MRKPHATPRASLNGREKARNIPAFSSWIIMFHAPSTQSLLCFEASARLRSFTAAAKELHLTQGAISRQIQTLEER
ncbi:LysR family transcriptional regulator, partial [uncultured Caballeronia sp.]|uniref:LysR family transcriptional regulator n=1 Tax=uncultured Caballeronia sp. TaxID=1827198 RepID=UPI0035CB7B27